MIPHATPAYQGLDGGGGGGCRDRVVRFRTAPAVRFVVRAARALGNLSQVSGFLRKVCVDKGNQVVPGQVLARLEVPDFETRLAEKRAEVAEVRAQLRLLTKGTRPEVLRDSGAGVGSAALDGPGTA